MIWHRAHTDPTSVDSDPGDLDQLRIEAGLPFAIQYSRSSDHHVIGFDDDDRRFADEAAK